MLGIDQIFEFFAMFESWMVLDVDNHRTSPTFK